MTEELEKLRLHVGESTTEQDVATASQAGRLAAALNVAHPAPNPGEALPQGWYGIFFPPLTSTAELREDGQPGTGLVPPVPLSRRRLESVCATFHEPIRIGDALTKVSEVADVSLDEHDGAPVVGVTITETISAAGKLSVVERRSFQFFGEAGPGSPANNASAPDSASWSRQIKPDPVLMFRLSAVRCDRMAHLDPAERAQPRADVPSVRGAVQHPSGALRPRLHHKCRGYAGSGRADHAGLLPNDRDAARSDAR